MAAKSGRGHVWRGGVQGALAAALLATSVGAAPISLLPPVMTPAKPARPAAPAQPVPDASPMQTSGTPAPSPVALPVLSDVQAQQLAVLLARNAVAQGLQETETPLPATLSNDALVRAALDQARAVRTGRLDQADFIKEWGIKPPVYDPLPAFADAVRRDRLAWWITTLPPPYAGYDALVAGPRRRR
jgi:hypothetical protein